MFLHTQIQYLKCQQKCLCTSIVFQKWWGLIENYLKYNRLIVVTMLQSTFLIRWILMYYGRQHRGMGSGWWYETPRCCVLKSIVFYEFEIVFFVSDSFFINEWYWKKKLCKKDNSYINKHFIFIAWWFYISFL